MTKLRLGFSNINISFGGQSYFPYSVGLLISYALKHIPDAKSMFEFGTPLFKKLALDDAIAHLSDSDVLFFSLSLWNAELSKRIAEEVKRNNPEATIIFGGCSVPPESRIRQFLIEQPYVDLVCHGEGEKVFTAILESYINQKEYQDWSNVPSVSFRYNGEVMSTSRIPRIKDLSEIPSPYLTGLFDKLMEENPDDGWIGLWETNRGCPYTCAFCEWGGEVGKGVAYHALERLWNEIDWFSENKVEFVRCADANFGIKPKRDIQLVEKLVENSKKYGYPEAVSVENTKNSNEATFAIQKILNDSGLSQGVNLAIQSLHGPSLEATKRKNISNELYAELQHMFEKEGIATFTDMIIGLPEESYDTFVDGVVSLIEGGQNNSISYYNALVLPNSEMGNPEYQERYGIKTVQIRQICNHEQIGAKTIHEVEDIVIGTNTLSAKDWRKVKAFAWGTSLLYHRKFLQVPLTIAHDSYGIDYRCMFEAFFQVDGKKAPVIRGVYDFFSEKARMIQDEASPNHIESERWLGMWWPADQFKLIELVSENKIDDFYDESTSIFKEIIGRDELAIEDAVLLNKEMLKRPFQSEDLTVKLGHNILEVYHGSLIGEVVSLEQKNSVYLIDRKNENWCSWEEWAKKVVWWKHKKSEYLYSVHPVSSSFEPRGYLS